ARGFFKSEAFGRCTRGKRQMNPKVSRYFARVFVFALFTVCCQMWPPSDCQAAQNQTGQPESIAKVGTWASTDLMLQDRLCGTFCGQLRLTSGIGRGIAPTEMLLAGDSLWCGTAYPKCEILDSSIRLLDFEKILAKKQSQTMLSEGTDCSVAVSITSPGDGSIFPVGTDIMFTADAVDQFSTI